MKHIQSTPEQLARVISHHEQHGANFISIRLACPVRDALKNERETIAEQLARKAAPVGKKPAKRANTYSELVKHSHLSAILNFDYAGNVNAQRVREGSAPTFEAQQNWFTHVSPGIVAHKVTGELYAFIRVLRTLSPSLWIDKEGAILDRETLLQVLPADELSDIERARYGMAPALGNANQELNKEVTPIAIKLANVRELVTDGVTYTVTAPAIEATPAPITTTIPAAPVATS